MLEFTFLNLDNFTPDFAHLLLILMVLGFFVNHKLSTKKASPASTSVSNINTEILRRIEDSIQQDQKNLSYHERSCQEKYLELVSSLKVVQTTVDNVTGVLKDLRDEIKGVEGRLYEVRKSR